MLNRSVRGEARSLMKRANVPALRFTLLYLAVCLLLDEVRVVLDTVAQREPLVIDPQTVQPEELMRAFASLFTVHTLTEGVVMFLLVFSVLLVWVLSAGYQCYCLGVARGETMPYECLFDGFSFTGKALGLTFLLAFAISAGFSLFFVPGILFYLMYRFALLNLCADPSIGILTAMKRSRIQTEGHKRALFLLDLSFLPLFLIMVAVDYLASALLSPLFPYSFAGDLLFALCASLPAYAVGVFLTPYRALSFAVYFTKLTKSEELTPTVSGN